MFSERFASAPEYKKWRCSKKKKAVPWRYDLEMSFLLPSLYTKNTQSNVYNEENLEDVQIDEQETEEAEMNTYERPEGQSNITREETSSSSHVIYIHKATFLRKQGRLHRH
jgi:hypothetical protein